MFQETVVYVPVDCCECSIRFFVPKTWDDEQRKNKKMWSCINGHRQHYVGDPEAVVLKKKLEETERRLATAHEEINQKAQSINHLLRSRSTLRGALTKAKKKNGSATEKTD